MSEQRGYIRQAWSLNPSLPGGRLRVGLVLVNVVILVGDFAYIVIGVTA